MSAAYGVTQRGNFEGRNILHRVKTDREVSAALRTSPKRVAEVLESARSTLYDVRGSRPPPIRDEKIIAAWNGMMISRVRPSGLDAATSLGTPPWRPALRDSCSRRCAPRMGRSCARIAPGKKASTSFLDDYAFMVGACLDLYEATGDVSWLERAVELQTDQDGRYLDAQSGGYYLTPGEGETLLVREKPAYDGAVPSGNSVTARNLLRLHDFTTDAKWRSAAERLFASLSFRRDTGPQRFSDAVGSPRPLLRHAPRGRVGGPSRSGGRGPAGRSGCARRSSPTRHLPF